MTTGEATSAPDVLNCSGVAFTTELGGRPARLSGRDDELDALVAAAEELRSVRSGSFVLVAGEAGIGKTALCRAVIEAAERDGLSTYERICWPGAGNPSLWPWTDLIGRLGHPPGDDHPAESRHELFSAAVGDLEEQCREDPLVAFVDDLHLAHDEALLFGRALARAIHRMPLLVVASWRGTAPPPDGTAADLWRDATARIDLDPLEPSHALELLSAYAGLDDAQRHHCVAAAGGNPLFVHELARVVGQNGHGVPASIAQVVERQLGALDDETLTLLRAAALLGPAATVSEVAAVAGESTVAALDLGRSTSGLAVAGPSGVEFRHEVVRQAVVALAPAPDVVEAHRRAVDVLAGASSLADRCRRAEHAAAIAPISPSDAHTASELCLDAGRELATRRDWTRAVEMFERIDEVATAHTEIHVTPEVGVEWAKVLLAAGRLGEARERFRAATEHADRMDVTVLAEAALGLGGVWVEEQRDVAQREQLLTLLERSLTELPATDGLLRARLGVRWSAEMLYQGGAELAEVRRAVDQVRATGDLPALAEALSLLHHTMLTPPHSADRLAVADELIEVATRAGDDLHTLIGHCWRTADLCLLGHPDGDRAISELRERVEAMGCLSIDYIVSVLEVMRTFRRGRLVEAELSAGEAFALGERAGDADATAYFGGQLMAIRWAQGRVSEIRDAIEELADSPTLKTRDVVFVAAGCGAAAITGDVVAARQWLTRIGQGSLAELPLYSTWLTTMFALTETAWLLRDERLAAELRPLLAPYADLPVRASLAITCLGPTRRLLALLDATLGHLDEGIAGLRAAISDCERLGNRPVAAILRAELAEVLVRRAASGDRAEATTLLRLAIEDGERLTLTGRVGEWTERLDTLERTVESTPQTSAGAEASAGRLERVERGWRIEIDGRILTLRHSVGLLHLARLLERPSTEVSALALSAAEHGEPVEVWRGEEIVDDEALRQYRSRITHLEDELDRAVLADDLGHAERLRTELGELIDHLRSVTGLDGRPRRASDAAERARMRVSRALRRTIDRIRAADPELGDELDRTVRTGHRCSYSPDPRRPRTWSVTPDPTPH